MNRMKRHAPTALLILAAIAMAIHGPIAQLPHYHEFADARSLLGLQNAADVLSNVGFVLVGLWGLWSFREAPARHAMGASWPGYALFFGALVLTAFGSGFYHLAPDDARLFWDRLPIALACAGLLSGAYADTHVAPYSLRLPVVLAIVAWASVLWWQRTADLRPYLLLQAAPLVTIPLWQALDRSRASERIAFGVAILLYVVAKIAELTDREIFDALGIVSGHTLKHLLAVAASAVITASLVVRARQAQASSDDEGAVTASLWDLQRLGGRGGP